MWHFCPIKIECRHQCLPSFRPSRFITRSESVWCVTFIACHACRMVSNLFGCWFLVGWIKRIIRWFGSVYIRITIIFFIFGNSLDPSCSHAPSFFCILLTHLCIYALTHISTCFIFMNGEKKQQQQPIIKLLDALRENVLL